MGFKDILNQNAKNTISETVNSTVENHCSKQVQMYTVARHLAKTFERNAPSKFRVCFNIIGVTIQNLMVSMLR